MTEENAGIRLLREWIVPGILSMGELPKQLGLSDEELNKFLMGTVELTRDLAIKISDVTETPLSDWWEDKEEYLDLGALAASAATRLDNH